jgi:hypothetical protein
MVFAKGTERNEYRFGRGVVVRHAICTATLRFDQEVSPNLVIQPEAGQAIQGKGYIQWQIAKEDSDPELILRLVSQPGNRWVLATVLGARSRPDTEPTAIGFDDPSLLLGRLMLYQRSLAESIAILRNTPNLRAAAGVPDIATQVKWMQTQQRETEQAIRQWSAIAELCDLLMASGKLSVELSHPTPRVR